MKREKYLKKLILKFKSAGDKGPALSYPNSTSLTAKPLQRNFGNIINPGSREPSAEKITRASFTYTR